MLILSTRQICISIISAFPVNQNTTSLEESAMQWKFVTLDKDKNNLLHKNEYRDLRKLVKKVVKPRRCSRMFIRLCDVNQNSIISKEEWMNCLKVNSSGKETDLDSVSYCLLLKTLLPSQLSA